MKSSFSTLGVLLFVVATCVACDKIKPAQPTPPEMQKTPAASGQANQSSDHEAFTQAAQKELDELREVIAELKVKAEAANLQTKAKLSEEVAKLEAQWRETQQRLMELKATTVESWNQLKESFSHSLTKLKNGIDAYRKTT